MDSEIDRIIEHSVLQHIDRKVDNNTLIYIWASFNCIGSMVYAVWWFRWICKQNGKDKYRSLQTEDDMDAEFGDLEVIKYDDEDDVDDDLEVELTNVGDKKAGNASYSAVNV